MFRNSRALDVNEINLETVALLRDEAERFNISVRMELAADLPTIRRDRVQLQQVTMNLIVDSGGLHRDTAAMEKVAE